MAPIARKYIEHLAEIGKRSGLSEPEANDRAWLASHVDISERHITHEWFDACAELTVEEHLALFQALAVAVKYSGWDDSSVSPLIWVFRSLEPRLHFSDSFALACWVQDNRLGSYGLPFGALRAERAFQLLRESATTVAGARARPDARLSAVLSTIYVPRPARVKKKPGS